MAYKQVIKPNLRTVDGLGWCLRFAQSVFNAPVAYPSARAAWDGQRGKHTGLPPKGVAVPVWFDHWGTYQGRYANWGHVAISLGDGRYFTSPLLNSHLNGRGVGSAYYPNMAAMQSHIGGNPKYLGWSESMNGKQVVDATSAPSIAPEGEEEEDEMKAVFHTTGKTYNVLVFDSRSGFASEYTTTDYKYNNQVAGLGTGSFVEVSKSHYDALKRDLEKVRKGA